MNFFDEAQYQASYRLTQDDVGTANVVFNINADNGTRLIITNILIKASNFASGRSAYVQLKDGSNNAVFQNFAIGLVMDNNMFTVPHEGNYAVNNESNQQLIPLNNGDYLNITLYNLAQNEYYDVIVRGYIRGRLPTIDTSGSSLTPTVTTNYARIV
tara:strand:+ start:3884 stop:4354 length:471 start_codon:yes stop_codon:yes gene_type:complete